MNYVSQPQHATPANENETMERQRPAGKVYNVTQTT